MGIASESGATSGFVGRHAELAQLGGALEMARAGNPQIVSIEGEPGIGKTAFLRRFLTIATNVVTIEASGDESETTLDYGVVRQLVARAAPPSTRMTLDERISQRPATSSFSVGADVLGFLGTVQDSDPVLLAVDDAHWIDSSSAAALLFALRRLHGDRVLVLLVSRPGGLDQLGTSWTRLLDDADRAQRIKLSGFTSAEIKQLADFLHSGSLTLAASERLREHTGGHPLYVRALLNELPAERLNFDSGPLPAPHSFSATVLTRLATMPPETQGLVSAAAVAGVRCPLALAGAVAGLPDPLTALEAALAADLLGLVPAQIPTVITFRHPLLRAAVYDDLSPLRRRTLHLAWAAVTQDSASLAHRVAASDGADDVLAAELRKSAEGEVTVGRLATAAERLLWASQVASGVADREAALLRAVECLVLAGDLPAADRWREAVLACGDGPHRSFVLGTLTLAEGRLQAGQSMLREVIAHPDFSLHPELEGPVTSSLAIACALLGHGDDAIEWSTRAMQATGSSATADVTATQARVLGLTMLGRVDEGIAELGHLSASRVEPEPFEAEMLAVRGNLKSWCGELRGAAEDLSAVLRWSRAGTPLRSLPNAYAALAEVEYRLGWFNGGLAHADVAVSLGEDSNRTWDLPFIHAVAGQLNAVQGNWETATKHVDSAQTAAQASPLPMCFYYACVATAQLAWVRRDWDSVLRALAPLQERPGFAVVVGLGQRVVLSLTAEAMLGSGQRDEATRLLDRLEAALDHAPADGTLIDLWRLRGALEHAREQPAAAGAAFARGQELADALDLPLETGLLELGRGWFLRHSGRRREAIAALRSARERLANLGANPFVRQCDSELAGCGVRSRSQDGENDFGLTAREDVVARLVASGKSNREVADELFLSTKAIEYHLGNVFAKVNVRSRHQLADRLATPSAGG